MFNYAEAKFWIEEAMALRDMAQAEQDFDRKYRLLINANKLVKVADRLLAGRLSS